MTTSVTFDDFCVGDQLDLDHPITGLLGPITAAEFGIPSAALVRQITTDPAPAGQILDAGVAQSDGTYTARVFFPLSGGPSGDTVTYLRPGLATRAYIICQPADPAHGPYTPALLTFVPKRGGKYG